MAGIKDILEIENTRQTMEDWCKINLFQEGSFYRAYEASAWLCHKHISQFKVTHRHVKGVEQAIAFVGFPVSSLEKRKPDAAVVESIADKHIVIRLPMPDATLPMNDIENEFAVWKSLQPMSEIKDASASSTNNSNGKFLQSKNGEMTLFGVAQLLLAYPIESHSPIDCMLFLADVKKELSKII